MKNKYTSSAFLFFLFASFSLYAQTISIPDENFEQALIDLGIDKDFTVNGQVAEKDIKDITELNVDSRNIGDLTGIESFTNLKILDVSHNLIWEINVSKNIKLETLTCGNNPATELDLSHNSSLVTLYATRDPCNNEGFSKIILKGAKSLEYLYCNDNGLSGGIDLSTNINLKYIDISRTLIDNLDLSNNQKLETILCDGGYEFECGEVQKGRLTRLDVSKNKNLISLYCSENKIDDLILNSNIQNLYCNNNKIKELNLSSFINLEVLSCEINPIKKLDLSNNKKLKIVNCSKGILEELNLRNGNNSNITSFYAFGNSSLQCIQVDNAQAANAGIGNYANWSKDDSATYSNDCGYLDVEDEILAEDLNVYPNPAGNMIFVDSKLLLKKVEIFNVLGQKELETNSDFSSISTEKLTGGIYFIKIYSDKGTAVRKLIKQ